MWITFFVSLIIIDLEHWVRNYSESQKRKFLLLHFLGDQLAKHWRKYEDFRKSSYTSVYIFSYTSASNKKLM